MAPTIVGYQSFVGAGKLAGTDMTASVPARTKFSRVENFNVEEAHGEEADPSATYHAPEESHLGQWDGKFDLEGPLWPEGAIELLMLSLMGDVTTTGAADPFTHTFKINDVVAASKAYMGLERKIGGSTKAQSFNAAVERVEVRGGANSYLQFSARGLSGKPTTVTSTAPTFSTATPLPGRHRTVLTLDAVTTLELESFSHHVEHKRFDKGYNLNTRFRTGAEYLEVEAGFEGVVLYKDDTQLEKFYDAAAATSPSDTAAKGSVYAADIKTTGQTTPERSLQWTSPKVFLQAAPIDQRGRNPLRQRIRGRALYAAGSSKAVELVLKNSVATV